MVVLLVSLLVIIAFTLNAGPNCLRLLAVFTLAAVGVQLRLDGYRWQMAPTYALAIAAVIGAVVVSARDGAASRWLLGGQWLLAALACGILWRYPLPRIPSPDGPFAVGTEVRYLVDSNRRETLAPEMQGPRELMIQFWYPTEAAKHPIRQSVTLARWLGWLRDVPARPAAPIENAPLAPFPDRYPVLLFSPSWHGQRGQNSFQVNQLVSHGFVVVGIDHPYSSAVTVFPDGRRAIAEQRPFFDLASDEALARSNAWVEKVLRVRVKDVEFVASELEKYSTSGSGDRFSGRLDLNRLGIFGYSFGGAVAAQICWEDPRFKAGMNMGGSMYGEVAEAGIRQPFLFIDDETPRPDPVELKGDSPRNRYARMVERDYRLEGHSAVTYGSYELQILGSEHGDYTDPPAEPPLHYYLFEHGTIAAERAMRIINAYTLAFFLRYLNHETEPLLEGPSSSYPEVLFRYPQPQAR